MRGVRTVPTTRLDAPKCARSTRLQISLHRAVNHDFARLDIGLNATVGSDRDARVREANLALNFAIDIQIGIARQFSINFQAGADFGSGSCPAGAAADLWRVRRRSRGSRRGYARAGTGTGSCDATGAETGWL